MNELTLTFEVDRTTKNTVRYAELSDEPVVGTLYLQKRVLGDQPPRKLLVRVSPA